VNETVNAGTVNEKINTVTAVTAANNLKKLTVSQNIMNQNQKYKFWSFGNHWSNYI
jgi:hypothetical protein